MITIPYKNNNYTFDENKVIDLRLRAIQNASKIRHVEYDGKEGPYYRRIPRDPLEIQNYSVVPVEDSSEFHFSYDEYKLPYLAQLLKRLLDKDEEALEEILQPNYPKTEWIPLLEKIRNKKAQLISTPEEYIDKQRHIMREMEALFQEYEQGNYTIPIKPYYEEAKALFQVTEKGKEKVYTD